MQRLNNILSNTIALIAIALMSASCLLEKEDASSRMQEVMIELSVSAGEMTKASVATDESEVSSLRIYAFYGNRLVGYASRGALAEGEPFYMDLRLPETGLHNVDFYLIANEKEMDFESAPVALSENMTRSQLEGIRFTKLSSKSTLPMYCKQTEEINVDQLISEINAETGHEGHYFLAQKIKFNLSRSLAKISLYAAKVQGTDQTPKILNAKFLAPGTRIYSYLFPQTDEVLDGVQSRANDVVILNSPVTLSKAIEKGSSAVKDASNYDLVTEAYTAEVTCGSSDWSVTSGNPSELVLHVEYALAENDGRIENGYIYMPRITRNTHYKVCVLINSEGRILLNYEVAPWDDNEMEPIVFDYPTHSYLHESITDAVSERLIDPASEAVMSETKPFVGYFQMTYPDNDSWTPTLMGPDAGNCEVTVYEINGNEEKKLTDEDWPIPASEYWYRIEVKPDPSKVDIGAEVRLAVTYKASGFDTMEYLLINGSYQEYYWPYSGTSQQDANYVIITMVN